MKILGKNAAWRGGGQGGDYSGKWGESKEIGLRLDEEVKGERSKQTDAQRARHACMCMKKRGD